MIKVRLRGTSVYPSGTGVGVTSTSTATSFSTTFSTSTSLTTSDFLLNFNLFDDLDLSDDLDFSSDLNNGLAAARECEGQRRQHRGKHKHRHNAFDFRHFGSLLTRIQLAMLICAIYGNDINYFEHIRYFITIYRRFQCNKASDMVIRGLLAIGVWTHLVKKLVRRAET